MQIATSITPVAPAPAATHYFVVLSKLLKPFEHLSGIYVDWMGAEFLGQLVKLKLTSEGVTFDAKSSFRHATCLTRAFMILEVIDPVAASEALRPLFAHCAGEGFFVMGWLDAREALWRPLWPEKPAFDLHERMEEFMNGTAPEIENYRTAVLRHMESIRKTNLENPS